MFSRITSVLLAIVLSFIFGAFAAKHCPAIKKVLGVDQGCVCQNDCKKCCATVPCDKSCCGKDSKCCEKLYATKSGALEPKKCSCGDDCTCASCKCPDGPCCPLCKCKK